MGVFVLRQHTHTHTQDVVPVLNICSSEVCPSEVLRAPGWIWRCSVLGHLQTGGWQSLSHKGEGDGEGDGKEYKGQDYNKVMQTVNMTLLVLKYCCT